ncbi:MAG: zinc ABC transporter substrate-binding protein, partial [Deltaproteobacteria bacterium]|nr:zinc ABC transporter substrate-binding protein [Deltaproteobacteria bacterium]
MRKLPALTALAAFVLANQALASLRVVATIHPLADLVAQIGGLEVSATTLLPAAANPHSFEPSPAQMRAVAQSALLVRVGAGLDNWADKLLDAATSKVIVVTVTDGMTLEALADDHGESEHGGDPHVWLDPILVRDHIVPMIL